MGGQRRGAGREPVFRPRPERLHPSEVSLRPERAGDEVAIGRLVTEAFLTAPHADGTEAATVEALRADGALLLSLVAEGAEGLAGCLAASPVTVGGRGGWAGIGPVAVRPAEQWRGIGSLLVVAALVRLRAGGAKGAILVGDPAWYGRFGFTAREGLSVPGIPGEFVLGFTFGAEASVGEVRYHPAFGVG